MRVSTSVLPIGKGTVRCSRLIRWAKKWDWGVGDVVARRLRRHQFSDWEAAVIATVDGEHAGFCLLEKKDGYGTDLDFSPFITAVYVDPKFRGRGVVGQVLDAVCDYARSLGFDAAYLISNWQGLYEKYGFAQFTQTVTISGSTEPVFRKIFHQEDTQC